MSKNTMRAALVLAAAAFFVPSTTAQAGSGYRGPQSYQQSKVPGFKKVSDFKKAVKKACCWGYHSARRSYGYWFDCKTGRLKPEYR